MGHKHSTLTYYRKNSSPSNSTVPLDDINIIWLDSNNDDKSSNNVRCLKEFREIVNSVRTFVDPKVCEEFLKNDVNDKQVIFLIVSDALGEVFVPRIDHLIYIDSIYVFCRDTIRHDIWSNKYPKVNGDVFIDIVELCNKIKQDIRHCQNDLIPIHILDNKITGNQLNQLEPSFMYSQLLKETLLNVEYDQKGKQEFIEFCRSQANSANINEIKIINEFENDYEKHSPIWWYTRECFVYEMLNKALRTENIDVLIKMAFFIRDLHRQIQRLYSSQEHSPMIVYRGQGMNNKHFEKLCQCKGGLISFQNFLSTSKDKHISLKFARRAIEKPGLRGIIFRMKIDPKMVDLSNPYASLKNLSYFENCEKEILFSSHTVFRIEHIEQMKDEHQFWEVYLKLTKNQDDIQLEQLTKHIREDVQSSSNSLESLAKLMLTIGEFDKAQQIYEKILEKTSLNDQEQLAFIYHQLGCVHNEKGNFDQALEYFQESRDIKSNYLPGKFDDPQLADTYSNIGSIYHKQGNFDYALFYFQLALFTNTNDQRILASIYNNIGMVFKKQGQFYNALTNFEKSLQIDLNSLPPTHPDLATTYSNIGKVYFALNDYSNALLYYQKTLEIRRLSLPPHHPALSIAMADYQNTAKLIPDPNSELNLTTSKQEKKQHSHLELSKLSNRISAKISICLHTIKGKY